MSVVACGYTVDFRGVPGVFSFIKKAQLPEPKETVAHAGIAFGSGAKHPTHSDDALVDWAKEHDASVRVGKDVKSIQTVREGTKTVPVELLAVSFMGGIWGDFRVKETGVTFVCPLYRCMISKEQFENRRPKSGSLRQTFAAPPELDAVPYIWYTEEPKEEDVTHE